MRQESLFAPPRAKKKTLEEARAEIQSSLDDGIVCPCCDKYVRRYRRKFNASMSRALIWLYRAALDSDSGWVDVPKMAPRWLVRTNQLPSVRWWGLIERHPNTDGATKHSGLWRVTEAGRSFVQSELKLKSTVVTYNGSPVGFEGNEIYIRESLGTKFDYSELMGSG